MKEYQPTIEAEGGPILECGFIVFEYPSLMAIMLDMKTKRGSIFAGSSNIGEGDSIPTISIFTEDDSLYFDEERKDEPTIISFPEYAGWQIFCESYSKHTINLCLIKEKDLMTQHLDAPE